MPTFLFANRASSILASAISDSATSLVLQAGDGLAFSSPQAGEEFRAVIFDASGNYEIIGCTERNTDNLSVITRGLEGTVARAWAAGTPISQRVTKAIFDAFQLPAIHTVPVENADDTPISSGYLWDHIDESGDPHPQYLMASGIDTTPQEGADSNPISSGYIYSVTPRYIQVRDQKSLNIDGGSAPAGSWTVRTLNTIVGTPTIDGASLASNKITLPAGTYRVRVSAPAMRVGGHQCRLYDVTAGAVLRGGTSEFADTGDDGSMTRSTINSIFTISEESEIRVEHICKNSKSTEGFGRASGVGSVEIYTEVFITKVA
jgi:hypothetical protein